MPLRLHNYGLVPERLSLTVEGVPAGWSAALLGGGQPVAAAMPATNSSVSLQLRVEIPQTADAATQTLTVAAEGQGASVKLPIAIALAKELPAKLAVEPKLPALRGSARSSFEYQITIKNDSGRNLLRFVFLEPAARELIVDWEERARRLVAEFRADTAGAREDRVRDALVHDLAAASAEFAAAWRAQRVLGRDGGRRAFRLRGLGLCEYEQYTLRVAQQPELKLTVLVPAGEP